MKAGNRIILLLAAVLTVALLVVGMTLVTSAKEGDLITDYGTVPAANANDNFAIFHKAEGASEYTFLGTVNTAYHTLGSDENYTYYAISDLTCEYGAIPSGYNNVDRYPFIIFTKATGATEWSVHDTASGVAYNFYKVSADETNTTYQLCPYRLTQYIPKTSVTLSSDLILDIYLPTSRLTAVSVDGVALTLADLPKVTLADGISYYHVTVAQGLTSALDTVELVTEVNIGGTYRANATRTVGIVKYAKSLLADSPTDVEATLVKDMLAYVKAAYNYVGNTGADAAIDAVIGADYTVAPTTDTAVSNLNGIDSAALLLNDTPSFVFYPSADYSAEDFKLAIGTTTASTEVTTIEGKTAILVKTYAYAMTNTVTYTVAGTDVSGEFNLAAYLAAIEAPEANSSDELIALVKALYAYSQSAKAYRAEATA